MSGYLQLAHDRFVVAQRCVDQFERFGPVLSPSLHEQAFLLQMTHSDVVDCLTPNDRINHRAINLGARQLGLEYDVGKTLFDACEIHPAAEVVARYPDVVSFPSKEGFVYFLEDAVSGRIKIGYSLNPLYRAEQVAAITNRPLTFVGLCTGTMLTEHRLHVKYRAHRIIGEWFDGEALKADEDLADRFSMFPHVNTAHKFSLEG